MKIVGSTGKQRKDHLGPRYSEEENEDVRTDVLLPIWTKLDFTAVPIDLQPVAVLRCYLLNRGVPTGGNDSPRMIREWTRQADAIQKVVMNPSLVVEPAGWVGFEPLDELELGDEYDDWVSMWCCCLF